MKRKRLKWVLLPALLSAWMFAAAGCGAGDNMVEAFTPNSTEQQQDEAQTSDSGTQDVWAAETVEAAAPVDTVEPIEAIEAVPVKRDYRTQIKGGGEDVVTLMVYLCGSDLESQGGAATLDLFEMTMAEGCENLNIVVETGGAKQWATDYMDPTLNQRWLVADNDLYLLENTAAKNMSEGSTLSDFITFSAENFPADRYMLVLWDHGGGTVGGYAYDERFEDYAMMSIAELDEALAGAGVNFDLIGFDCCLMGTIETTFMVEQYADYMVASQRVEPGDGWYYTSWISALSRNTSMPTAELGAIIVDSYIEESGEGYYGHELTLSVTDLTYIPELFDAMYGFFSEMQGSMIEGDMFVTTSHVLGNSRAMQSKYDLVDMAFLLENLDGSDAVLDKLRQCVIYNGATIENHNGLCLYFPYADLGKVNEALSIYDRIGIDESYRNFIAAYANMMLGGQVYNGGGSANPLGVDGTDLDSLMALATWADEDQWTDLSGFFADNSYDSNELLAIEELDGEYVLTLSDEEWELMTYAELMVYLDDGEGYIDLGSDCKYEFDGRNLYITFDNTWVALDGQLVCYYNTDFVVGDDYWYIYGVVPILLDGEEAELVLVWDDEYPDGYVAGWRYTYTASGSQKGLFDLWDGMYFDFLCDYYTYDGEYDDQYLWGGMTVDGPVTVGYEDVGDDDCLVYYALYDIFQNTYWTEPLVFSLDY